MDQIERKGQRRSGGHFWQQASVRYDQEMAQKTWLLRSRMCLGSWAQSCRWRLQLCTSDRLSIPGLWASSIPQYTDAFTLISALLFIFIRISNIAFTCMLKWVAVLDHLHTNCATRSLLGCP